MTNRSPNILVIQADQMTPGVLPIYGHSLVQMPHLRELATNGVVFDNAYCNFPLCVPSRVSMLAGRLANSIAAWDNAIEMPASIPTLAHYLRDLDYHTVLCGKMHFIGPDQVHGFNERITTDVYPSNFAWTPDWVAGERYRPTGINMRAVVDAGICVRGLQIDYDEEVAYSGVQKLYDLARFHTENPFLLWVSFTHPHSPFVTTQHYWDLYDHNDIPLPTVPPVPLDEMDAMSRWLHYAHAGDRHTVTDDHVRNARHAYYGMCSYIDDKVGQLLATLRETGLDENTLVVFTADHGEMLGERGMWFKQCFYEWSVRVPLVFHFPKRFAPRRVTELVSLVDLLPTFMDIASNGQPPEPVSPLDGASLVDVAQGVGEKWRDDVISEYTGEGVVAPCRMIRRGPYKFIYTHGHPPLLYDLQQDPAECCNLANRADYADLVADLQAAVLRDWEPETILAQCIQSQRERLFIQKTTGGEPNWAYRYRPDDGDRYIRNAGAVETKAKSRYPFVEPTPFER